MNIRRNTHRSNPNYRELNIKVKRSIWRDIRDHNNSMIESVIENHKNMRVLKSLDENSQARIYQMKNKDGGVIYCYDFPVGLHKVSLTQQLINLFTLQNTPYNN